MQTASIANGRVLVHPMASRASTGAHGVSRPTLPVCQSHWELPGSSIWWVSWLRPRASTRSRWLSAKARKLPVKASRLLLEARRLLTKARQLRPEACWLLAEARWLRPDAHWLLAEAAGLLLEAGWRQRRSEKGMRRGRRPAAARGQRLNAPSIRDLLAAGRGRHRRAPGFSDTF